MRVATTTRSIAWKTVFSFKLPRFRAILQKSRSARWRLFARSALDPPPPRSGSAGVCKSGSRFFQLKVLDSCSYGVRDARKSGPAVPGSPRQFADVVGFLDLSWLSWLIFGHLCRHRFFKNFPTRFCIDFGLILALKMDPKSSQNPFKIDPKT